MITFIARHEFRQIDSDTCAPHRNAMPNARAPHASTRAGFLNASTKSLTIRPVSPITPNSCSGMSLRDQAQEKLPHRDAGLSRKWSRNPLRVSTTLIQSGPREAVPPARALVRTLGYNNLPPYPPPEPRPCTSSRVTTHSSSRVTSFSVLSSLIFPRIPPEPHVPLSSLGAERFQISEAVLGELDMKLYVSRVHQSSMDLNLCC